MCLKYVYKIKLYGFVCKKKNVRPGRCKACAVKSLKLLRIFKLSFMKVKREIQAVSCKGTHNRRVARPEKRVRQAQPRLAYKS